MSARTVLDEGSEERHVGLAIARPGRRRGLLNGGGGLFRVLGLVDLVLVAEPIEAAHLRGADCVSDGTRGLTQTRHAR